MTKKQTHVIVSPEFFLSPVETPAPKLALSSSVGTVQVTGAVVVVVVVVGSVGSPHCTAGAVAVQEVSGNVQVDFTGVPVANPSPKPAGKIK
jgi:hypothetical protein